MLNSEAMTWIMLRGLTREHRHWEDFPQHLQSSFPNATILTPDIPGCGLHNKKNCPARIKDILDFVRTNIQIQSLKKPVYILGLSLGAMIAIEWLQQYPHEIAGAVLMNTSLKGISPFYHRLRPQNYLTLLATVFQTDIHSREQIILDLTSNLKIDRHKVIENWTRYATENPISKLNALRQLWAASRYKATFKKPQAPVLLLNSQGDRLVNPQCSRSLSNIWQLPLFTHPSAGHDLTLDAPEWVCNTILKWMSNAEY